MGQKHKGQEADIQQMNWDLWSFSRTYVALGRRPQAGCGDFVPGDVDSSAQRDLVRNRAEAIRPET